MNKRQVERKIPNKLEAVLSGLDTDFALSELRARQRPGVQDKDRAHKIIEMRYGLGDGEPMTLAQIAGELGVSSTIIRHSETASLLTLARLRDETRPERAFERDDYYPVDGAYLYPKRIAKRSKTHLYHPPKYHYPEDDWV